MMALLFNGSDWPFKTVTNRTLKDTKLVRDASLSIKSCSREYELEGVPYE